MDNSIWLTIEDVSRLTGEIKETVRRKCKRGEYISSFVKNGRYKIYSVLLSSLPVKYHDEYKNIEKNDVNEKFAINCEEYALAPLWSRKQADKYLELFSLTNNMKYNNNNVSIVINLSFRAMLWKRMYRKNISSHRNKYPKSCRM